MGFFLWEELIKEFHYIPFQIILICLIFRKDTEYRDIVQNRFLSFLLKENLNITY